ncbi:DUF4097 domain-containing protein [Virgibacillus necropolis]|uniref:DUF4097 family beta strand repeat-containing protein n=1 Tax=Virgibacillus necropolis TaxID=163877 RepID=UPI00384C590A
MSNIKKIAIIGLTLLVIGAVGSFITFQSIDNSISVDEERIVNNNAFTEIEINADNQRVEIIPTDDSQAKVALEGRSREDMEKRLSVDVEGDKLSIEVEDKKVFSFFHFMGADLTLRVSLPEKQYESLQIDIDNGTVHAEQLNIKDIHAETNNGHLELEDIQATSVKAESDNGKISLKNVSGELYGETNNGEINLETTNLNRPIVFECDNGRINIETDKEPTNATFNVHVDNGHINIFDKYSGNAVFGNGENMIELSTNNGEITVTN